MWTGQFWKETAERAVLGFAVAAAGLLSGEGMGLLDVDWTQVGSIGGLAAVTSVLISIIAGLSPLGTPGAPTFVSTPSPHASGRAQRY